MKRNERLIVSVECTTNDPTLRVNLVHATVNSLTSRELLATHDRQLAHSTQQAKYEELVDTGVIDEDGWILEGTR